MPRFRLTIEYAGTRYSGWQIQKNARTVQGELHQAIASALGKAHFETYGAGRTDAGVHALGQVANFVTASVIPCERFLAGLTHFLPHDIVLRSIDEAPEGFHSQYQAKKKRYR